MAKKNQKYRYKCFWDNGKGAFNADLETCRYRSRPMSSLKRCVEAAINHAENHGWSGWGYPPLNWKNECVYVYRCSAKKDIFLGEAYKIQNKLESVSPGK